MNLNRCFFKSLLATSLITFAFSGFAQEEETRLLILETEPEATMIELMGSLRINADGNMVGTPVDPEACTGDPGDGLTCEDVEVGASTFRVNGSTSTTVEEGQAVSFTWNSRGAWSCNAGGDLPNWNATGLLPRSADVPSSQRTVSTANLAEESPYQASLICSNGPVVRSESVSITVNPSDVELPDACSNPSRQMPSNWTQMTTGSLSCSYTQGGNQIGSADCRSYHGIWGGSFMDVTGISLRLGLRNNQARDFMAIAITTEGLSPTATGTLAFNTTPSLQNSRKLVTISQCPGDFDRDAIMAETGCYRSSNTQNLEWGGVNSTKNCKLEANKTYFLNIVYTLDAVGTPSSELEPTATCSDPAFNPCGNLVTNFQ